MNQIAMTHYFIVFATDHPGLGALRDQIRPRHRSYLRDTGEHGVRVHLGGPTLARHGNAMNGTLLVVEAASHEQVRDFVENDPYMRAGLFAQVEIRAWNWTLGQPEKNPA